MKNKLLSVPVVVAVFAAVLPLPPARPLPSPPRRPQPPAAPGAAMPIRTVQITLDYVMTPADLFHAESRRVASGKQHDAQLLAVLLNDREFDMKQSPVAVRDGGLYRTALFESNSSQCSYIRVRPRFNADGSVTVRTKIRHETLPPVPSRQAGQTVWHYRVPSTPAPSVSSGPPPVTNTFVDGQTLILGGCEVPYHKAGVPFLTVVFAKVQLLATPLAASAAWLGSHP